jgi:predicted amidophosphoribosyltransferase
MGALDGLLELIAPTRCAGCEMPGALLCEQCDETLPRIQVPKACPRCGAPWGSLICTECWSVEYAFEAALSLGELDGALARAIVLHKDAGERRLGEVLGRMLGQRVAEVWPGWADTVTWIPPSRAAIKRRGFDHGRALADPVGIACAAPVAVQLERARAWDQRRLGRSARLTRAQGSFEPVGAPPHNVLIVDDVMTTGATVDAAAATLLTAGAARVRVAVVGRAW